VPEAQNPSRFNAIIRCIADYPGPLHFGHGKDLFDRERELPSLISLQCPLASGGADMIRRLNSYMGVTVLQPISKSDIYDRHSCIGVAALTLLLSIVCFTNFSRITSINSSRPVE